MVTGTRERQSYPDHPDRFQLHPQVLCDQPLIGCTSWEVRWRGWVRLSVSYRSIARRGAGNDAGFGSNQKSWCLHCDGINNRYSVVHNHQRSVLHVRPSGCDRVAVYVDCPAGRLSFYRVTSDAYTHLHTFTTCFTETLYAGFQVVGEGSSVSLCEIE